MGQGSSRETSTDERQFSGVRVAPGFVEQLREASMLGTSGNSATDLAMRTRKQIDAEAVSVAMKNEDLSHALQRSHRVGDMLLQREEEELVKIEQLADELIHRQYQAPARERPCQQHAAACLACYNKNSDDPTECSGEVEAYAACAREASASVIR